MTRGRIIQLVFFLVALAALLWLLHKVGWSNIGQALVRVGLLGGLVIVAFGFAETILDSIAVSVAIHQPRAGRVIFFNSLGGVLNQLLPFDLGEVIKVALLHRTFPGGATIPGTIIWNYIFKISRPLVTLLAALIGLLGALTIDSSVRYLVLLGAVVSFLPYVGLRLVLRQGAATLVVRLLRFLRIVRRNPERIVAAALEIDRTAIGFWQARRAAFLSMLFLQMGARLASWLSLFAALRLMGTSVTFAEGALLYAAMNTAELLIGLLPARLGVGEGAAFAVFKLCGLSSETGVIMYVILRLKNIFANGSLAPFAFLRMPNLTAVEPTTIAAPSVTKP